MAVAMARAVEGVRRRARRAGGSSRVLGISAILLALALGPTTASLAETAPRDLVLGMFSYRPADILEPRWQPLAERLSAALPDRKVRLRLLNQSELQNALDRNELDLLFTNPVHFIRLRQRFELTGALATLVREEGGATIGRLGGVIITQAGRKDLTTLEDLQGKRVLAVGPDYLGGYLAPAYALVEAGVALDRVNIVFNDSSHDAIVQAVLAGEVDAGLIRTGILEELQAEGALDLARLTVLNRQQHPGFPFIVSSRLYPEWPIVALPHLDRRLARTLAAALLDLRHESPVSRAAGIEGFDLPADYSTLETAMRRLRVPPFDAPIPVVWRDIWNQHRFSLLLLATSVLLMAGLLAVTLRGNRRLSAARAMIAATEKRWLNALDGAGHGVWDWNFETGQIFYSRCWKSILGYAEQDVVPSFAGWEQLVHPEDLPDAQRELQRHIEGETESYNTIYRMRAREGQYRWILARGLAISRDDRRRALRVVGTITDITRYRETEIALAEQHELYAAIIDQAVDGILLVDSGTHRFIEFNQALCASLGYSREEFALLTIADLDAWQTPAEQAALVREIVERGSAVFDTRHRRKDGALRDVRVSVRRIQQRGQILLAAICTDLTDLRAMEAARAQAMAEVERLAHLKNTFLANMSHEIRTPLNAVLGLAQIGRRDNETNASGPLFRRIQEAGQHLLALLNDILDFSRIEADKLPINPHHLSVFKIVGVASWKAALTA